MCLCTSEGIYFIFSLFFFDMYIRMYIELADAFISEHMFEMCFRTHHACVFSYLDDLTLWF